MGAKMKTFNPDLIVEVTSVCNRACSGCYAPNIVTNKPATDFFEKNPELFLRISGLNNAFNKISVRPYLTTIRGGEPSLHPQLDTLLLISQRKSNQVMLETHARWLLPQNVLDHQKLVEAIKSLGVIIKISFDKMHGLSTSDLQQITDFLDGNHIDYCIAITEATLGEFLSTRSFCPWIKDDNIIFQLKAKTTEELVSPGIGVINAKGEFKRNVTSKFSIMEHETFEAAQ